MAVAAVVPVTGVRRHSDDRGVGALARLDGRTLLAHALASLEASPSVTAIVVVTPPEAEAAAKAVAAERVVVAEAFVVAEGFVKVTAVVPGGPTRQGSVALGLAALPPGPELVAVHEAARPLAGPDLLGALLERLLAGLVPGVPAGDGPGAPAGVVPGVPVVDTVRRVGEGGRSRGIVDRGRLRSIQTPQLFIRAVLEEAHRRAARAGVEATDDAALVEWAGHPVRVVPGPVDNLKVTTVLDLTVAEAILARRRGAGAGPGAGGAA